MNLAAVYGSLVRSRVTLAKLHGSQVVKLPSPFNIHGKPVYISLSILCSRYFLASCRTTA